MTYKYMKLIHLFIFSLQAALGSAFFYGGATQGERSWIFNGKHIVTSYSCIIFSTFSYDVDNNNAIALSTRSGNSGCQHDGMVSPSDGRFYVYQFEKGIDTVFIYDLGDSYNIVSSTLIGNITGFTGNFFVLDPKHSLLYFSETNIIRVYDITNPVMPKLAEIIPTSLVNSAPVRLSDNYLYHSDGVAVKRIDLSSSSYTETLVIQPPMGIPMFHVLDKLIIVSTGNYGGSGGTDLTYWIDPLTLIVLRTTPTLYQIAIKIGDNYLASQTGDWQAGLHFTVENITDISSPQTLHYDPSSGNSGYVWTRFSWENDNLYWPNYWVYNSIDMPSKIPGVDIKKLYNDSGLASYGYIDNPLVASGSKRLSGYLSEYVVLSESILDVFDESVDLPFATIEIRATSNSQIEKLVNDAWVALGMGSFFTPQDIRSGSIRVNLVTNDPIKLDAYQLGASLPVTLTVETGGELSHASKSRISKSNSNDNKTDNGAKSLVVSIFGNRTLMIIFGVVIIFLLGSFIVGIRVFIWPLRKKALAKNHRHSHATSDYLSSSLTTSMTSTKTSTGSTSMSGNTTLAASQTALPLALPGYQQFTNGKDYVATKLIGGGGMSEVFLGKVFNHDLIIPGDDGIIVKVLSAETSAAMFRQEISIMSSLSRYPFFVKLLGFSEIPQTILMRNYAMGDLKKYLTTPKTRISKRIQMSISYDVARGIRVMHKNNLAHSDIKAENILLLMDAQNRVHGVISDFGITKILDKTIVQVGAFVTVNVDGMSIRYAAPELFLNQNRSPNVICAADVYAYGVLMYFIETRTKP